MEELSLERRLLLFFLYGTGQHYGKIHPIFSGKILNSDILLIYLSFTLFYREKTPGTINFFLKKTYITLIMGYFETHYM